MRADIYDFYSLGLGDPYPVSSVHGIGTGDVLDAIVENLPTEVEEENPDIIRFSLIGRPNVGKSSLINAILGEDRVIASPIAGTTRDAIDLSLIHIFLNLEQLQASGQVVYDNGLYLLDYQLSYDITLPSSRSLEPATLGFNYLVSETFIQEADAALQKELVEENLVLILNDDTIDLNESILDNILLNIPLSCLLYTSRCV